MPRALDPTISKVLEEYGEDPRQACWDCHGVWVVYHKAIERIAAKAGITFEMPEVVQASAADRIAVIIARGFMGERSEWSFGEAAPNNNKNSYPFAMAEKRAKDRVVLTLVGLHGLAYSEDESDDFKADAPPAKRTVGVRSDGTQTSYALKQSGVWNEFQRELTECETLPSLTKLAAAWKAKAEAEKWNDQFMDTMREALQQHKAHLLNNAQDDDDFPGDRPSIRDNSYANNYAAG